MAFAFETTFTSASSVLALTSAFQIPAELGESVTGRSDGGHQILRLFVESEAASEAATLYVIATENISTLSSGTERKFLVGQATVTGTAIRTNAAGTGGNYLCTVAFTLTSRDTFDLLVPKGCKIYLQCSAIGTGPLKVKGVLTRSNS